MSYYSDFFYFLWSLNIDGHLSRLFSLRYSDSQVEGKTRSPILKRLQTGCEGQKLSSSAYLAYESYHMIFASGKNFSIWTRQSHDTYAAYDMHVVSHNFWSFLCSLRILLQVKEHQRFHYSIFILNRNPFLTKALVYRAMTIKYDGPSLMVIPMMVMMVICPLMVICFICQLSTGFWT